MAPPPAPRLVILLKASRGYHVVDVRTILHAEAEARFCRIYFTDGTDKAVFHTLTELEEVLHCGRRVGDLLFLRVHNSHILALHHATELDRRSGITLASGMRIPVARDRWTQLLRCGATFQK